MSPANKNSEIGRELKVSELKPRQIVLLWKEGRPVMSTMWVVEVGDVYVHFWAGEVVTNLMVMRRGPDLEEITDSSHLKMKIFEYLGKP